jgi:coproporphyrinogen III oxidase
MRFRFEKMIRGAQDSICAAIEEIDGTKFRQDAWVRQEGGGGITRVLQDGNVWEKVGLGRLVHQQPGGRACNAPASERTDTGPAAPACSRGKHTKALSHS